MNRRKFLTASAIAGAAASFAYGAGTSVRTRSKPARDIPEFVWEEATVAQLQKAMVEKKLTAHKLTKQYLERIHAVDRNGPGLNSIIELNPDALGIARDLDRERAAKGPRGPLHGIPVLLKDNIDTSDRMTTTAGSLALQGSIAERDAFLVAQLRKAGAVILGKTNLSEWANFRSNRSTSGWSGRGGLTRNPYALDRNTSGSSSGSAAAVSANLCALAVGTETDGSIVHPSSYCGIVGIKPTVGLISRSGIIPISKSQDTAGPMARTVEDAATLLGVLAGTDPRDEATAEAARKGEADYRKYLRADGLRGARIGVVRAYFSNTNPLVVRAIESALKMMKAEGAEIIDPVEFSTVRKFGSAEFEVMLYEFKDGLNKYLAGLPGIREVRSLKELIEFNERNKDSEMPHFSQETLIQAETKGPLTESAYLEALEKCRKLARTEGIDSEMDQHMLDALVAPSGGPAHVTDLIHGDRGTGGSSSAAAVAGYPNITVPCAFIKGLPAGISFFGRAYSEPVLLRIAYAFEQAQMARRAPTFAAAAG